MLQSSRAQLVMLVQLLVLLYLAVLQTLAQRNAIVNLPDITCEANRITVRIRTQEPFHGRVFLKGNSARRECVTDFSEHPVAAGGNATQQLQVAVDYNLCNTERIRQLQPSGIIYANTVIVQFHSIFITTGDKAFNIRCFYSESDQTVTNGFDVSMIPTGTLTHELQMPDCSYTVRRATSNGPVVRSAQVGDTVYHRWSCDAANALYGMLVHDCYVENSSGQRTLILDQDGCSLDAELLPALQYSDDLSLAYSQARVFKYPDNSFIYFRCQIRLCSKVDDGCRDVTPPRCPRRRGSLEVTPPRRRRRRSRLLDDDMDEDLDVLTPEILVLDEDSPYHLDSLPLTEKRRAFFDGSSGNTGNDWSQQHDAFTAQLCSNRILLLSMFLASFILFAGSCIFMVYVVQRQQQAQASGETSPDDIRKICKRTA